MNKVLDSCQIVKHFYYNFCIVPNKFCERCQICFDSCEKFCVFSLS